MYGPEWIILGAAVGASGAILAQIMSQILVTRRENRRFKIEAFERFRREFSEDPNLRRISIKKEPLEDDEVDDYIGFFEEIGLYYKRGLVDLELVDEVLGDAITQAYLDDEIMKSIGAARGQERDSSYFRHFEHLAKVLLARKSKRIGG